MASPIDAAKGLAGGAGMFAGGPVGLGLGALMSFAPGLLSGLFGKDPQKELRDQIMKLLSRQGSMTDQAYQNILGSAAYQGALGNIATGANATGGQLASSLAARGIGTTGTGAITSSVVPSIVGSQQAKLKTSAYDQAQQQVMQQIQQQIAALTGTAGPSRGQQLFAGGLDAFAPLLQNFLKSKYPSVFGAGA